MKRTALPNGWHMVDDRDVVEVELEALDGLAPIRFPGMGSEEPPAASEDALKAADDVCRRMEVLARELQCLVSFDRDDGPRAA